jgi:hypothetical protein
MLSLRSTGAARPASVQRRAAVASRPARAVAVRADNSDALRELQAFQQAAKAKMQASLDEAQASAGSSTSPRVMAAQVRAGARPSRRMSRPPGARAGRARARVRARRGILRSPAAARHRWARTGAGRCLRGVACVRHLA